MKRKLKLLEISFLALSISILSFLLITSIFKESLTYDEQLHVRAGYTFLTQRDFRVEPFNPPFSREIISFPLLFNPNIENDLILLWPRLMTVFVTIMLSLLVYSLAKKIYGQKAGILAFLLFIFEPNILAHGHLATTDITLTFFVFLTFYLFYLWKKKFNYRRIVIFSIVFGLTLSTKISALPFLLFSFVIILLFEKKKELFKFNFWRKRIIFVSLFIVISALALWSTYFFTIEPPLGLRFNPNRQAVVLAMNNPIINFALTQSIPLGSYISSIKQIFLYNYSDAYGKMAFFNGTISEYGFLYFFPVAFLIKTQLFLFASFLLSIILFWKKKENLYLLIPIITIVIVSMFSTLNLGLRYVLPIYPFVIVLASQIMNLKVKKPQILYGIISLFLIWNLISIIKVYPHYITYSNELTGGYPNGYHYLIDSNFDWGQGLVELKEYQDKNKISNLQLAYFGLIKPSDYGIIYERIQDANIVEKKKTVKLDTSGEKVIAISATCWYYCGYYKNPLIKDKKYDEIIGGSILIFK